MPKITKPDADRKMQRASMLETNAKGEVEYAACFAAGTLVHTDRGLLPVEQVRVGVMVLSTPENSDLPAGQGQEYRRVINTVATLDQRTHAVQVKVQGEEQLTTVFPTPNHPFWVEGVIVDGQHWLATECLVPGMVLQLADGRKATVHANGLVRRTQHENIGFAVDHRSGILMVLDLSGGRIALAAEALAARLQPTGQTLQPGAPYLMPVYNFEVEQTHTYYVGETAVWVHNTNCPTQQAAIESIITREQAIERINQRAPCFEAGTLVHTKEGLKPIEEIQVGDWVLSYPEDQTPPDWKKDNREYLYRQVTRTFVTDDQLVSYIKVIGNTDGETSVDWIGVTSNHPIYEHHSGFKPLYDVAPDSFYYQTPRAAAWRPVSELKFSSCLTGSDFGSLLVMKGGHDMRRTCVYNLEVDEFHTYFVGKLGIWVHNECSPVGLVDRR